MARSLVTAVLAALLLSLTFWAGLRHDDSAVRMSDARLPNNVQPHAYHLELHIDPNQPRFSGVVTITVALRKTANQLLMHGRDLNIKRIEAQLPGGRLVAGKWKSLSASGLARIDFDDVLPDTRFTIQIEYDAPFGQDLRGLYRLQVDDNNYAFTQFESTDARSAFPCFDEPRFKTSFTLAVTTPADMTVVSNTLAQKVETVHDTQTRTVFAETARLPTYLIALAIGKLDIVDGEVIPPNDWRERPIPIRGITIKGHGETSRFMLKKAPALLLALEQYFGVQYPFEKLDLLIVPESSAGNMENAAIPTFSERGVAVNEKSSLSAQRGVIRELAHELAHQWFGNLVSITWWNDVWLKESFASWIAPKVSNTAFPELHFTMATKMDAQAAMFDDARATQRSLHAPIEDDADIETQYAYGITYEKGAGILAMFETYIGARSFQQGLRNYFARHAFGNATAEDFMRAVAESTGNFDMPASIATFMKQPGVPHINIKDECLDNKLQLHIVQSRYLILGSDPTEKSTWRIPFCVSTGEGEDNKFCQVLDQEITDWKLPLNCDASVMPNASGAGYFYWSMSQPMLERLLKRLPQMNAPEAMDVANNISASLAAGKIDINVYLRYLPALTQHWHPHVITRMIGDSHWIMEYVASTEQRPALMNYLRKQFGRRLDDLGVAPPSHYSLESYFLRVNVFPFVAISLQDQHLQSQLIEASYKQFGSDWKQPEKSGFIAPDLIPSAYAAIVQKQPRAGTEALLSRLAKEKDMYNRAYIIGAIAFSDDPYVIEKIHGLFDSDLLDADEKGGLLEQLLFSSRHTEHIEWIMANFDRLIVHLPENRRKQLPQSMGAVCDSNLLARERAFYLDQHKLISGNEFDFVGGIEAARQCIALRNAQPPLNVENLREH